MIGHKDFPSRSGGVEVMVGGLARSLVERGYDVTMYNRGLEKHHNVYDVDGVHARRVLRSFTAIAGCSFCPATPRGFLYLCWRHCPSVHGVW